MSIFNRLKGLFEQSGPEGVPPVCGRNEPCWCGSGLKYKKCHLQKDDIVRKKHAAACCTTKT